MRSAAAIAYLGVSFVAFFAACGGTVAPRQIEDLMSDLGYLRQAPAGYRDLRFLEALGR